MFSSSSPGKTRVSLWRMTLALHRCNIIENFFLNLSVCLFVCLFVLSVCLSYISITMKFPSNSKSKLKVQSNLIYKAQIVCLCVCVCVCMFAFGGHVFCPFATEIGTHTRHAQGKVCVKELKKLCTGAPLEGSTPA